jgi:hypothetical protein
MACKYRWPVGVSGHCNAHGPGVFFLSVSERSGDPASGLSRRQWENEHRYGCHLPAYAESHALARGAPWYLEEQGNFHPITSGEAYWSAQLDQDELEYYIRKFEIRSIINLRGQ